MAEKDDPRKSTYGTGKIIKPGEEYKGHKEAELPGRIATSDGKILDLDSGTTKDGVNLCGRVVDLDEIGESGEQFIVEMYEQFLSAVHQERKSTYADYDAETDLANSYRILEYIPDEYHRVKRFIRWRTDKAGNTVGTIVWNENRNFGEWMIYSLATLKWRYHEDMLRRQITDGLTSAETNAVKAFIGELIAAVERWLEMPESKKLVSV